MKPSFFRSTWRPASRQSNGTANNQFSDSSCGEQGDHNVLVTYASGFGTTREVAEAIGKVLCQGGARVEIKWIKNVTNLEDYDAVIIGSAIQYDNWMPEARKFITAHQHRLSKLPVAFFFTCLTLARRNAKSEQQALAYSYKLSALHPQVKPISVGRFSGVLDYSKLSLGFRLLAKGIFAIFGIEEGDYRDWDAIRNWAKSIHSELNPGVAQEKTKAKVRT